MKVIQNTDITNLDRVYTLRQEDELIELSGCSDVEIQQFGNSFIFNYPFPLSQWCIPHNLSKLPQITLLDENYNTVIGDLTHLDFNFAVANFTKPYSGMAIIN